MRLVYTVDDPANAKVISSFLAGQGIENQMDITSNTDWGTPDYGTNACRIWIYDEDQLDASLAWVEQFKTNSANPIFQLKNKANAFKPESIFTPQNNHASVDKTTTEKFGENKSIIESLSSKKPVLPFKFTNLLNDNAAKLQKNSNFLKNSSIKNSWSLTTALLALCCLIFVISQLTTPTVSFPPENFPANLPYTPLTAPQIKKELLYDYPESYEILDRIVKLYGFEKIQNIKELPQEGQFLLNKYYQTPYWTGFYDLALKKMQGTGDGKPLPPMFEKIQKGEVWRLFTPSLLHSDILHLVFNMLWLIILGRQIEQKVGKGRYLLMVILLGVFSNTCQYLMGGPNFLGLSGVICGMLTFIWMRQKRAPWEGYPLQRSTFLFMIYFILAMFLIQFVSFFLEAQNAIALSPGIANTAHLSGAILGLLLGCTTFFSWKTGKQRRLSTKRQSK